MSFVECDQCRVKLGSPILCGGCLSNRAEIERLRGMLVAHDINPDGEYIAKGGLRVNAPASNCEPKF